MANKTHTTSETHLNNLPGEEASGPPEDPLQQASVTASHQLNDIT